VHSTICLSPGRASLPSRNEKEEKDKEKGIWSENSVNKFVKLLSSSGYGCHMYFLINENMYQ